jgi:hypothetical protein
MTPSEQAIADKRKAIINWEINNHPVTIDRRVFSKTTDEKKVLKVKKKEWKKSLPIGYKPY